MQSLANWSSSHIAALSGDQAKGLFCVSCCAPPPTTMPSNRTSVREVLSLTPSRRISPSVDTYWRLDRRFQPRLISLLVVPFSPQKTVQSGVLTLTPIWWSLKAGQCLRYSMLWIKTLNERLPYVYQLSLSTFHVNRSFIRLPFACQWKCCVGPPPHFVHWNGFLSVWDESRPGSIRSINVSDP